MIYKKHYSYGIIPLRSTEKEGWETLLIKHGKGHWAFPKGHAEADEEHQQTAMRELQEETGLQIVSFLDIPPLKEHYSFREGINLIEKTVIYYPAKVTGQVVIQANEISDYRWVNLLEAAELATFLETKKLCEQIYRLLP